MDSNRELLSLEASQTQDSSYVEAIFHNHLRICGDPRV